SCVSYGWIDDLTCSPGCTSHSGHHQHSDTHCRSCTEHMRLPSLAAATHTRTNTHTHTHTHICTNCLDHTQIYTRREVHKSPLFSQLTHTHTHTQTHTHTPNTLQH